MIRDKSRNTSKKPPAKPTAPAKPEKRIVVRPSFRRERALIKRGVWPVAGCDEAGRGPLAGPVVAAAVVLDPARVPKGLDDSKRLSAERREELFEEICATASFSVAVASPARIDRDNILRASLWALARAVHALPEMPRHVFVDGRDTYLRIHGTNQPEYIGQAISSGCIRMNNADVIDLYQHVKPGATVVVLPPGQSA